MESEKEIQRHLVRPLRFSFWASNASSLRLGKYDSIVDVLDKASELSGIVRLERLGVVKDEIEGILRTVQRFDSNRSPFNNSSICIIQGASTAYDYRAFALV